MRWTTATAFAGLITAMGLSACASEDTSTGAGGESGASDGAGGSPAGSTSASGGAASGGGGAGGGAVCDASQTPEQDPCVVSDELGVFVRNEGKPLALGTRDDPAVTFHQAIEIAVAQDKKRIYACAQEFPESVELPAGISIFGGLECAKGWAWNAATKTQITGDSDEIALRITAAGDDTTRLEDIRIAADDATVAGGSSIAMLVVGATVQLDRCQVVAGLAKSGVNGADAPVAPPPKGPDGAPGGNACGVKTGGGLAATNVDCSTSIGGKGGDGGNVTGVSGDPGVPEPVPGSAGDPGDGESDTFPWSCEGGMFALAGNGWTGGPGAAGTAGASATGHGTISLLGWTGVAGSPGSPGAPGQGGGGGGGTKGGACAGSIKLGAGGGSGGGGGCGGLSGGGGAAGGASIGLISVNANVLTVDSTFTTKSGGSGGNGGSSQPGGLGGVAGNGGTGSGTVAAACKGGAGGPGGAGAPGGGGGGGHSVGIAYLGAAPTLTGMTMIQPGTAGEGGVQGDAGSAPGEAGVSAETLPF